MQLSFRFQPSPNLVVSCLFTYISCDFIKCYHAKRIILKFLIKRTYALCHEEEADTKDGDDGTKDGSPCDFLMEQPIGWEEDDDRCHCHQRGGYASCGVLNGHQRKADSHEWSKDGCGDGSGKPLAVMQSLVQGAHTISQPKQQGEARDAGQTTVEVGTEGQQPQGHLRRRRIMVHAYLTQHQSYALTEGCSNGEEHAARRQPERYLVMLPAPNDGDGDAGECHHHGKDAHGGHLLSQGRPRHDGCRQGCKCHEQLTIAGTDDDITLEEAVVTYDVAHQPRQEHPATGFCRGSSWQRVPCHCAEHDGREEQGKTHSQHVQREIAQSLGAKLTQQGGGSPREGDAY